MHRLPAGRHRITQVTDLLHSRYAFRPTEQNTRKRPELLAGARVHPSWGMICPRDQHGGRHGGVRGVWGQDGIGTRRGTVVSPLRMEPGRVRPRAARARVRLALGRQVDLPDGVPRDGQTVSPPGGSTAGLERIRYRSNPDRGGVAAAPHGGAGARGHRRMAARGVPLSQPGDPARRGDGRSRDRAAAPVRPARPGPGGAQPRSGAGAVRADRGGGHGDRGAGAGRGRRRQLHQRVRGRGRPATPEGALPRAAALGVDHRWRTGGSARARTWPLRQR